MTGQFAQPAFDTRITTLTFPLAGGQFGQLQRGFMVWDTSQGNVAGYSSPSQVNFLYNPSSVSADYSMSNGGVAQAALFPTAFNAIDLRVPLNQTVEWSLLFDRTYELWGQYNAEGTANTATATGTGTQNTNPAVVGVLADIMAMQQFTGMFVAYSTGNTGTTQPTSVTSLTGWQGIMQLILILCLL